MAKISQSKVFELEPIKLGDNEEYVLRGGRELLPKLPEAFDGIKQIGVIGWSAQGPAQAQNLRESLAGTDIRVVVGLREGSQSIPSAEAAGFTRESGTLGEMFDVIRASDLTLLLIADAALADLHDEIFAALKPGSTLGLSHGFLIGHLDSLGKSLPDNINVVGVCPKGMGRSVRRLYEQGSGINASVAIEQDINGKAVDHALGWAVGLGSPAIFETTLTSEYTSDIFGERGILLGAAHGIVETLYRYFIQHGATPEEAFRDSVEVITGPISKTISRDGITAVYEKLDDQGKMRFRHAYSAAYRPAYTVLTEIYDEVASGTEIRSIIMSSNRLSKHPMGKIEGSPMWQVGEKVRAARNENEELPIHPVTAGVYIATMMAQVDVLKEHGHPYSEIANESIIEAVDSLNPYMHAKGVAHMVDNCSTTARLGTRKWGPRFDHVFMHEALPDLDQRPITDEEVIENFFNNDMHQALATCAQYRPPIDIAVTD
jgi:ketol-acid reductoisomerase